MGASRTYTLTEANGVGRIVVLIAAFAYYPPSGRTRSIEQLEVEAEIKEQLFGATREVPDKLGAREYKGGDQVLTLTLGQVEILRQRILEFPFWNPLQSDQVAETYRWLGTSS